MRARRRRHDCIVVEKFRLPEFYIISVRTVFQASTTSFFIQYHTINLSQLIAPCIVLSQRDNCREFVFAFRGTGEDRCAASRRSASRPEAHQPSPPAAHSPIPLSRELNASMQLVKQIIIIRCTHYTFLNIITERANRRHDHN